MNELMKKLVLRDYESATQIAKEYPHFVNVVDSRLGMSPLHVASYDGAAFMVRNLISEGADPELKSTCSESAMALAFRRIFELRKIGAKSEDIDQYTDVLCALATAPSCKA